ncbi:MAG: hypothetical protein JSW55_16965 [Chloroflexota bacterium]|nr:MAG: hypothetical protein JSW55_16965 [Chloroflexota bacterium]
MAATIADRIPEILDANSSSSIVAGVGFRVGLRTGRRLLPLLLFLAISIAAPVALAQSTGSETVDISARAGYDSYYKGDFWTPVHIEVANTGPEIQGHLQIVMDAGGGGSGEVIYRSPVSLPTQSNKRQTLYVFVPSFATALSVELIDHSGRLVASTLTNTLSRLATESLVFGVVTEVPGRLEYLDNVTGARSEAAVAYMAVADLPEAAAAWNALDVIVIHSVDSGQLTVEQRQALEGWLDAGGLLVVTGGPAWQETTAGLANLLPVSISGTQLLDDIPALRELSGLAFRDPGPYLLTNSGLSSGEALLHHAGSPLLARREHGRGSAFFLALDPSLAPLLDWDGSQALWSEVAGFAQLPPDWAIGIRNSYAASSAVTSLPAVGLPSAWGLFLFLMIYVLVVGPLNYFILRRLGRRELAWVTIPGLVLFFTVTAYLVGFQLKGNDTIINQMSIAFGRAGGDQLRVQTLIGLYSPRRATYDLALPTEAIPRPFEQNFGALSGPGHIGAIERAGEVTVSDIRVDIGGVETLVADSYQPAPSVTGAVRLRTEASNVVLDVDVQNNGPATLENATILVGSTAIPLGDLASGSRVSQSERVTALQPSAGGPIIAGSYLPPAPAGSPLISNMETILGSTNYYNDREIFPRWQLLQALGPEYGPGAPSYRPAAATLVAWTQQPQLDLRLVDAEFDTSATTLYFLELPMSQEIIASQEMVVPRPLLDWRVLDQNGVYDFRVSDLYLPPGWIEFEFTPWPDFRSMSVRDLTLVLQAPDGSPGQRLPRVQLWDWEEETWRTAGDPAWGRIAIEDPFLYVGPSNAVRLRLQNEGPEGIEIRQVFPELSGRLE